MSITGESLQAVVCLFRISPESLFLELNEFNSENIGEDWNRGLLSPTVLSHLKLVEMKGVQGCNNELKIIEFLLKNAMLLEELVLFSCKQNSSSGKPVRHLRKFYNKIRTLPRTSSSIGFFFF